MSFLTLPNGFRDFKQITISFWFKVPQESILAVAQAQQAFWNGAGPDTVAPRMLGIIPLMVWGIDTLEGYQITTGECIAPASYTEYTVYKSFPPACPDIFATQGTYNYCIDQPWVKGNQVHINPSHIGIDCSTTDNDGNVQPRFVIHIQMKDLGSGTGMWVHPIEHISDRVEDIGIFFLDCPRPQKTLYSTFATDSGLVPPGGRGGCLTDGYYPGGEWKFNVDWADQSDYFIGYLGGEVFELANLPVIADKWNHVLFSLDLGGAMSSLGNTLTQTRTGCGANDVTYDFVKNYSSISDCRAYLALNDQNMTGDSLSPGSLGANKSGPNAIATRNAYWAASNINEAILELEYWLSNGLIVHTTEAAPIVPTFSYSPGLVPARNYAFGIPASSAGTVYHVEMAELQMFMDTVVDTGVESNRRAFLDLKGQNTQNTPSMDKGDAVLYPVKPETTAKLLGLKQSILLHGSKNWKSGKNTGTLGVDGDGQIIQSGQFTPTGEIKQYKPDPSLTP